MDVGFTEIYFLDVQKWTSFLFALFRAKDCAVGYPILDYLLSKEYAVGCLSLVQASALLVCTLPIPQWRWTIAEMSASVWTSSTSVQTFGAIIHPNSEFWQRIGQPCTRKPGRCLCPTLFWSGRRAGNKQSPDDRALQAKLFHVKQLQN